MATLLYRTYYVWVLHGDDAPTEGELQAAVVQMSHERCVGASGIRAKHIQAWLCGAKREEDPETPGDNEGAGKTTKGLGRHGANSPGYVPLSGVWERYPNNYAGWCLY